MEDSIQNVLCFCVSFLQMYTPLSSASLRQPMIPPIEMTSPIDAMIQADNNAAIPLVLVIKSKLGYIALSKPVISIQ
jgi:hypothetical protein